MTAKRSGTLGSGTWVQPVSIGSTMLKHLEVGGRLRLERHFLLFRKSTM